MIESLCIRCRGKGLCGKPCKILSRFIEKAPKPKLHFSGSSPPEIFVGRINYPNVFSGILAPSDYGEKETEILSTPEQWVSKDLQIDEILELRGQLIYGRGISHIKSVNEISSKNLKQVTAELALSDRPVSTEFFLKKLPTQEFTANKLFTIMTNPAPIKKVSLEENPHVHKKVDYLTSDYDVKAVTALGELYKTNQITTTHLQKLFSAGLLGTKNKRKMVPTRWSITAVDDTLGKKLLEKIRYYPEINKIELFHHDYNGNHFEILLLPSAWSFEVIEVSVKGNVWGGVDKNYFMQDYESFFPRKSYAENVVGAYYADRLAVLEYLEKIKKQASVLVLHEERPEYYAPLGVGIIRESIRKMFSSEKKENPISIEDAFSLIKTRTDLVEEYKSRSWLLKNYGKQKKITDWFN